MEIKDLFHQETSFFHKDLKTKDEVIAFLAQQLSQHHFISSENNFIKAIKKREKEEPTGMGEGIAIPHALNPTVKKSTIAFLSLKKAIPWGGMDDQPVNLIFMIATNGEDGDEHLKALASLSGYLLEPKVVLALREAKNFSELEKAFSHHQKKEKDSQTEIITEEKETSTSNKQHSHYDLVGITACPTGIAHTYLAQDKILEAAKALGLKAKVETQGRRGIEDRLTAEDIANAKYIILAHDKALEGMDRFNGYEVIDTSTKDVIYKGKTIIENYKSHPKLKKIANMRKEDSASGDLSLKKFKDVKGNLLAGVSKMLPFVVAGGIVLGIAFLIDWIAGNAGGGADSGSFGVINKAAGWFAAIGKISMMMMVPILGAYIAYTIAGTQALMPGMVAGLIADNTGGWMYGKYNGGWSALWSRLFPQNIPMTSSFLGAMAGGYMAALIVFGLTLGMRKFKRSFQGVRDIVFIPVLSLLGIALVMFAIDIPLGYLLWAIQKGLEWLANHNLFLLLGAIIGLMMCIDMGGPINKIAYVLGTLAVSGQLGDNKLITVIMAAAMAGGMVPPLGIALCTVIFRKEWTLVERNAAKANWLMGAFFITEGAIPFMVTDPKRVSISALSGGLITGLLVGAFKITLPAPHGGICVFPLLDSQLFSSAGMRKGLGITFFILAILAGMFIMAAILGFWKKIDIRRGKLNLVTEEKEEVADAKK